MHPSPPTQDLGGVARLWRTTQDDREMAVWRRRGPSPSAQDDRGRRHSEEAQPTKNLGGGHVRCGVVLTSFCIVVREEAHGLGPDPCRDRT